VTSTYALYHRLASRPQGRRLFSAAFALKAPYFRTVLPDVRQMQPHHAEVRLRSWWGVHNHLGTVHVIAICNGLEAAMGLLAEATVPDGRRWIPKGMTLTYPAKADSDLRCIAESDPADWENLGEVPVRVRAERTDGTVVVEGTITLWVTERSS